MSNGLDALSRLTPLVRQGLRAHDLDLRGADLATADLSTLCADGLDLRAADLSKAKLCRIRFESCRLERTLFPDADWSDATLRLCALDGAQGNGARFDNARLEDSSASGADLTGATLRNARLTETSFERALLRSAVLDHAEGAGVEFRGADLAGASLIGARFDEADFRGADLRGADLTGGRFRNGDFRGALLEGARLDDADCEGSHFDAGQGPQGKEAPDRKESAMPFDAMAATALREGLSALPGVFAARDSSTAEFLDRLGQAVNSLNGAFETPPEEWKAWLEPLLKIAKREGPIDPKEFLNALCKAPAGLQSVFAGCDSAMAGELLDKLRRAADAFETGADQPPEAWKPWLEPLLRGDPEKPLDLKAFLDALSAAAQRHPPNPDEPKP